MIEFFKQHFNTAQNGLKENISNLIENDFNFLQSI